MRKRVKQHIEQQHSREDHLKSTSITWPTIKKHALGNDGVVKRDAALVHVSFCRFCFPCVFLELFEGATLAQSPGYVPILVLSSRCRHMSRSHAFTSKVTHVPECRQRGGHLRPHKLPFYPVLRKTRHWQGSRKRHSGRSTTEPTLGIELYRNN